MRAVLKANLLEEGVFIVKTLPVRSSAGVAGLNLGLTFEQQKELLLLQLELQPQVGC